VADLVPIRRRPQYTGTRTLAGLLSEPSEVLAKYKCQAWLLQAKRESKREAE
jgi:hypothetical protein